jgi:hypothetical protein
MTTFSIHQVPNITHKMPNWLFFYDKNKILSKVKEKDVQALHESEVLSASNTLFPSHTLLLVEFKRINV